MSNEKQEGGVEGERIREKRLKIRSNKKVLRGK
jgi:hypothetical protein